MVDRGHTSRPEHEPAIVVLEEIDTDRGWSFLLAVNTTARASHHRVSLSWVDHDHWSAGSHPPARVIAVVVTALVDHLADTTTLKPAFDASMVRRIVPDLDDYIARRL